MVIPNTDNNELEITFSISELFKNLKTPAQFIFQVGHINSKNNFFILNNALQGFVYSNKKKPIIKDKNTLISASFPTINSLSKNMLWLDGQCATPLRIDNRSKLPALTKDGLNVSTINTAWATPSDSLINQIQKKMNIHLQVKMLKDLKDKSFCALLTQGSYKTGFRILVSKDRLVLFQIADVFDSTPLFLFSNKRLNLNEWTSIDINYQAPENSNKGKVSISINGNIPSVTEVPKAISFNDLKVIALGCEYKLNPFVTGKKIRPNFPGIIRTLSISK